MQLTNNFAFASLTGRSQLLPGDLPVFDWQYVRTLFE